MDSPATDEPSRSLLAILAYWMDVEALTPPDAEDDGDTDANESFFARHVPDRPYPWAEATRDPDKIWKHFVRFGIFGKEAYHSDLVRFLNTSRAEDFDTGRHVSSKTYGFAGVFEADNEGFPVLDSLRMPAFALAFQGVRDERPISLDEELDDLIRKMKAAFNEAAAQRILERRTVDDEFIDAIRGLAAETLRWLDDRRGGVPKAIIRSAVVSVVKRYPSKSPRTPDGSKNWEVRVVAKKPEPRLPPIDSFYLEDLRMLYRAVRHRNPGLLGTYIAAANDRIDCTVKDFIQRACRAPTHPPGRWPSKHELTLMQQVAVDLMWRELRNGGLFSVNGPPGTGKTTLLMDLVAAVVVHRAEAMCAFEDPGDAFVATEITAGPDKGPVWQIHQSLADHLIVVASSNNGAVENVTVELPNAEKVDLNYLSGLDFFSETANAVLGEASEEESEESGQYDEAEEENGDRTASDDAQGETVAWGLVAGVLGNRRNRKRFVSALCKREIQSQGIDVPAPGNIFAALARARSFPSDWRSSRRRFMDMLASVQRLQEELDSLDLNDRNERQALAARDATEEAERAAASRVSDASEARQEAEVKLLAAEKTFERIDEGVRLLAVAKPFRLRLSAHAVWHERYTTGLAERSKAVENLGTCEDKLETLTSALSEARDTYEAARHHATVAKQVHLAPKRKSRAIARRHPRATTPEVVAAQVDERQRQQMLPGTSARLHDARAKLFVEALRLHLAFACAAGARFDRNLELALAMVEDQFWVRHVVQKAASHLWATLALVTPVISTTFASLPRTFRSMGPGSIPWLLIDEAGQCAAHHAAGGIWRAKRAIVVGDPFQVEPVITMDRNADKKLAERRGVPERLFSTGTSTQRLADEAGRLGTWVTTDKDAGPIWVGCPLTVHRRCVEPMFGISNRLAYNGRMVLADGKIEIENELTRNRPLLGPSAWIDVPIATGGPKHFISEQADIVRQVVRTYLVNGFVDRKGLPDVFVVTPFRSVADGIRSSLIADLEADGVNREKAILWGKACIGTVHTVQGREKDSVVLFLGGTSEGAIQWASGTPNILNVAVSRAKRRLYVVGHRTLWLRNPLVMQMAGVRVVTWREAGRSFGLEDLPNPQTYRRGTSR